MRIIDWSSDVCSSDLRAAVFEGPQYAKWNAFRQTEDARFVCLTLPNFLLRVPYGDDTVPTKQFRYNEDVSGGSKEFLWGNAAFAFASRLSESFAQYRWCANIIGPQGGGTVGDLPVYTYEAIDRKSTRLNSSH